MKAIYKKELKSYFTTVIGCMFMAILLAVVGLYYYAINLAGGYPYFGYTLSSITMILIILIPILSMRSMAEERRQKTDQMLLTAPLGTWQMIVSKYLAMLTIFAIPVVMLIFYPLIMANYGTISYGMSYTSILGFFLVGGLCISIGLFMSALTESQVIAAVLTFLILFVSYMMTAICGLLPSTAFSSYLGFALLIILIAFGIFLMTKNLYLGVGSGAAAEILLFIAYMLNKGAFEGALAGALSNLSLTNHYSNFLSGILDIPGIVFYVSASFLFLFFTVQAVEKRRWC